MWLKKIEDIHSRSILKKKKICKSLYQGKSLILQDGDILLSPFWQVVFISKCEMQKNS